MQSEKGDSQEECSVGYRPPAYPLSQTGQFSLSFGATRQGLRIQSQPTNETNNNNK